MRKLFLLIIIIASQKFAWGAATGHLQKAKQVSTIPMVGGYSNARQLSFKVLDKKSSSDPLTVGIVTHVQGRAFIQGLALKKTRVLKNTFPLVLNDKILVKPHSRVFILTVNQARVEVVGPAYLQFAGREKIRLTRGSAQISTQSQEKLFFENAFLQGYAQGRSVVWADEGRSQVLNLRGHTEVWHPQLSQSVVVLQPAFYTEMKKNAKQLQPKHPMLLQPKVAKVLLSKFQKNSKTDIMKAFVNAPHSGERGLASESDKKWIKGSRSPADVFEPYDASLIRHLYASVVGRDLDEGDLDPFEKPALKVKKKK